MKITTYSIRFDGRTKELILLALSRMQAQYETEIAQGNEDDVVLETYDQLGQVRRGILLSPGEEVETDDLEISNSETLTRGSSIVSSSRVGNSKQLEKLIMDVTSHDLNRQMQQLVSDYKKTGDQHYLDDAAYLRSEFETWWNSDDAEFVPPAQL